MQELIVLVVGTRPDALKLIPVYQALVRNNIPALLCATNQHTDLLNPVFDLFKVTPDVSLHVMKENQTLEYLTSAVIEKIGALLTSVKAKFLVVQGDTTSSFAASLAAFYHKIPIAHVEAGLRTGNKYSPFPEEINRSFITPISSLHFAPTPLNALHLLRAGVEAGRIFCVGNTIVDALFFIKKEIENGVLAIQSSVKEMVNNCVKNDKKLVLLTTHRRESFDGGLLKIFKAVRLCVQKHPELFFCFPMHPNPHVRKAVEESGIGDLANVQCCQPLAYNDLIYVLSHASLVMTDSGGIQEEAISLGKQVLILRDYTERVEAIWEGLGVLVGTDTEAILAAVDAGINQPNQNGNRFIYGSGCTAELIVKVFSSFKQDVNSNVLRHTKFYATNTCQKGGMVL